MRIDQGNLVAAGRDPSGDRYGSRFHCDAARYHHGGSNAGACAPAKGLSERPDLCRGALLRRQLFAGGGQASKPGSRGVISGGIRRSTGSALGFNSTNLYPIVIGLAASNLSTEHQAPSDAAWSRSLTPAAQMPTRPSGPSRIAAASSAVVAFSIFAGEAWSGGACLIHFPGPRLLLRIVAAATFPSRLRSARDAYRARAAVLTPPNRYTGTEPAS